MLRFCFFALPFKIAHCPCFSLLCFCFCLCFLLLLFFESAQQLSLRPKTSFLPCWSLARHCHRFLKVQNKIGFQNPRACYKCYLHPGHRRVLGLRAGSSSRSLDYNWNLLRLPLQWNCGPFIFFNPFSFSSFSITIVTIAIVTIIVLIIIPIYQMGRVACDNQGHWDVNPEESECKGGQLVFNVTPDQTIVLIISITGWCFHWYPPVQQS